MDARLLRRHVRVPEDVERPLLDCLPPRRPQRARPRSHAAPGADDRRPRGQRRGPARARGRGARLSPRGERGRGGGGVSGRPGVRACLARTWLIARLAGSIEIARHQKRRLREILALSEEKLIAGLGGVRAGVDRRGVRAPRRRCAARGRRRGRGWRPPVGTTRPTPRACATSTTRPPRSSSPAGVGRLEALAGADLEQGPRAAAIVGTRRASADGAGGRARARPRAGGRGRDRGQRHGPRASTARPTPGRWSPAGGRWRCWRAGRTCPIRPARRACTSSSASAAASSASCRRGSWRCAGAFRRATGSSPRWRT